VQGWSGKQRFLQRLQVHAGKPEGLNHRFLEYTKQKIQFRSATSMSGLRAKIKISVFQQLNLRLALLLSKDVIFVTESQ
jgi:hypothetical protein